jgi:two-component system sensor histidine kinase KdpD
LQSLKDKLENRALQINIPQDLPEIPMDYSLMMRVLVNLIDNALKYSPNQSSIQISARQSGNRVRIEISDEGFGIPEDDLKRIFDKFYRAVKPRQITGTGLGLSICKGIVEAHSGKIWAQNNTDKGATFFIELPLSKEN